MLGFGHEEEVTMVDKSVGKGLGLVSIGLGLTEVAMPQKVDQFLGTGNGEHAGVFRVLGFREILHGIDLLTHEDPTPGVWGRVAGDMLDGAILGLAATKTKKPSGILAACALVLPIVALDMIFARKMSRDKES